MLCARGSGIDDFLDSAVLFTVEYSFPLEHRDCFSACRLTVVSRPPSLSRPQFPFPPAYVFLFVSFLLSLITHFAAIPSAVLLSFLPSCLESFPSSFACLHTPSLPPSPPLSLSLSLSVSLSLSLFFPSHFSRLFFIHYFFSFFTFPFIS